MSRQTENYNWTVPVLGDPPDITLVSEAFDEVDNDLNTLSNTIGTVSTTAEDANTQAQQVASNLTAHNISETAHEDMRETASNIAGSLATLSNTVTQNNAAISTLNNNTIPSIQSQIDNIVAGGIPFMVDRIAEITTISNNPSIILERRPTNTFEVFTELNTGQSPVTYQAQFLIPPISNTIFVPVAGSSAPSANLSVTISQGQFVTVIFNNLSDFAASNLSSLYIRTM